MKIFNILLIAIVLVSCGGNNEKQEQTKEETPHVVISKPNLKLESDVMTPEVLWSFGRLGDVQVSPDKTKLLYGVSYYSKEENKGNRELYTMNIDGSGKKRLTETSAGEFNAVWCKDGKKIALMSYESGEGQMWMINADGSNRKQVSSVSGGITAFGFSPDYSKVFYTKEIKLDKTVKDVYPDLEKSSGRVMTELMYRHWDTWVDTYSHVFIADFKDGKLENNIDLLEGEKYETPMKPFGGIEQISWSADSKKIAYTCRKKTGVEYTLSTNSDIYLYDLATKETENLTEGMMGYDVNPVFTTDGKSMIWESMERDGYESDKNRLFIMNLETKEKKYLTENFDQNVGSVSLSEDDKFAYFVSDWHATDELYKINLETADIKKITEGIHN